MKKTVVYCLQLLGLVAVASLASCGSSDPVTPVGTSTITVQADPNTAYGTSTPLKFEKGEKVKIKVKASVPGGIQIFNVKKKVGSAAETDITSSLTSQGLPAAGATGYEKVFELDIPVAPATGTDPEPVGSNTTITFNVKNSQATSFTSGTFSYQVVAQGQGGGGGVAPLLRALVTVGLGSQTATEGSYFTSALGANGVTTNTQTAALSAAAKQAVDITFGVGDANGIAKVGTDATHNIIMSPTYRNTATNGFNEVPLGADARATTFKTTTGITSLTGITSTAVNNIDHSTGTTSFVAFTNTGNPVFSFRNSKGAKGYVRVASITGTGDQRVANLEVLVQVVQ